jgi:hypothetical protein
MQGVGQSMTTITNINSPSNVDMIVLIIILTFIISECFEHETFLKNKTT